MKSMTAFGRAVAEGEARTVTVELKSVNSRFLDASVKLPRAYLFLEEKISLPRLFELVESVALSVGNGGDVSLDAVFDADMRSRAYVREAVKKTI